MEEEEGEITKKEEVEEENISEDNVRFEEDVPVEKTTPQEIQLDEELEILGVEEITRKEKKKPDCCCYGNRARSGKSEFCYDYTGQGGSNENTRSGSFTNSRGYR